MYMEVVEEKSIPEELGQLTAQFYKFGLGSNDDSSLNPSKFRLLNSIKYFMKNNPEGIKASDLGHHLEITPARITHMVNSLEKDGYVERLSVPNDRRIVLIKLTEKGKNITEIISKKFINLFFFNK